MRQRLTAASNTQRANVHLRAEANLGINILVRLVRAKPTASATEHGIVVRWCTPAAWIVHHVVETIYAMIYRNDQPVVIHTPASYFKRCVTLLQMGLRQAGNVYKDTC